MLDRNAPLLFHHLERRYPYFRSITPNAMEALFVPLRIEGKEVGAIWAVRHDEGQFDAEDLRQLEDFAPVAAAAYRATQARALALSRRMKNSSVDCVCEIEKAEAMVPSRLAAPPNTTTRKVSTM